MKFLKGSWNLIKILLTILVILFFVFYFINNRSDFSAVFSTPLHIVLALFALNSLHFFLNGLFILNILKSFGHQIKTLESFYISTISSFGNNFIPMQGGAVIRSVYLKKTLNFPYAHFVSSLYGNYIIIFGVNAFFALITLFLIHRSMASVPLLLFLFFGLLFTAMLVLALVRIRIDPDKLSRFTLMNKARQVLHRILEGWARISGDKGLLLNLVLITVINLGVMAALFGLQFSALGLGGNPLAVLLYNCLSGVSLLVSLTPGALGVREGIFFLTSDVLGLTEGGIMQLALLDRGVTMLTLFFWFIVLSGWKSFTKD